MIDVTVATFVAGTILGFLWQKAKACSITGYRDLYLFRDTYLLKTIPGMFIGAVLGFLAFWPFSPELRDFPLLMNTPGMSTAAVVLLLVGGLGFGVFSVLAGGCPTKQHVAAASGSKSSMLYLVGFYAGILYFQVVILEYLLVLFGTG